MSLDPNDPYFEDDNDYLGGWGFPLRDDDWNTVGERGRFEVFYMDPENDPDVEETVFWDEENEEPMGTGYYWWPCLIGCLPDSEPWGPYPTAKEAYIDAWEGA